MIIAANRKNLKLQSRMLLGVNWTPERERELIKTALRPVEHKRGFHPSHGFQAHLEELDAILGTYGVEGMMEPDVQYCNTGKTYAATLLYWNGKLRIGDWGSIVEACEVNV